MTESVILDTNVFVAAGFNSHSYSARIVADVRKGKLRMVWNESTRREIQAILKKIPPLAWEDFADLFRDEAHYTGDVHPDRHEYVPDPDDRKFMALAEATGATLVSQDDHLLGRRDQTDVSVLTPEAFVARS